jgi:hypothetical protein
MSSGNTPSKTANPSLVRSSTTRPEMHRCMIPAKSTSEQLLPQVVAPAAACTLRTQLAVGDGTAFRSTDMFCGLLIVAGWCRLCPSVRRPEHSLCGNSVEILAEKRRGDRVACLSWDGMCTCTFGTLIREVWLPSGARENPQKQRACTPFGA